MSPVLKKMSGWIEFLTQSGGVGKAHSFEVYCGQKSSVISVSACLVLFPDIRVRARSQSTVETTPQVQWIVYNVLA